MDSKRTTSNGLTVLASCLLACLLHAQPAVATDSAPTTIEPPAGAAPGSDVYRFTLKQLGAKYPMNLRGVDGSDSVAFDVRADRLVTGATLNLEYSYSPSLLPDLSQINVMVNDQVAASIPVPKETAGTLQQQSIAIPPHLITEFNRLTLQLIGHYTMQCEDPKHSSLWAKIGNGSQLVLDTQAIALPDDLSRLPMPFFDKRDARHLTLPFVFAGAPDEAGLEAAGALSSWFGALASYRGASFPVSLGELPPKGNAVVLVESGTGLPGVALPDNDGPSISLVVNPQDPYGKFLVVSGRDGQELKQAAIALATGSQTLSGQRVRVNRLVSVQPRKPYDAPNWLPSDRPVTLGELIEAKRLSVSGYDPGTIGIPVRLPPDLFNWREKGMALSLKYRYTPQPVSTNSSLLVSVNDKFLKSFTLPSVEALGGGEALLARLKQDDSLLRVADVHIPLDGLPLRSELQFRYMYDFIKQGECRDVIIDNMRGAIEPDSTLDLSGYDHYIAMPNLGVFQGSGFPFTRMADLSETAVVLPSGAGASDIGAYLTVLGLFGASTGYPATAVTVAQPEQAPQLRDKDLLVFASGANQPLLKSWERYLPASLEGDQQRFELSDLALRVRQWISPEPGDSLRQVRSSLSLSSDGASSYIAGFESPVQGGRSVVVIAGSRPEKLADATDALLGGEDYDNPIEGSLAVVQGKRIQSLAAQQSYYVGSLGVFRHLQWLLSRHLSLVLLLAALGVALLSGLAFVSLRARARRRLGE